MDLRFFTQQAQMRSPTYYRMLKGQWPTQDRDFPSVNMTVQITVIPTTNSDHSGEDMPVLNFNIENKMWQDPINQDSEEESIDDPDSAFSLEFNITRKEAIYLSKHIEAFIKSTAND